jgi:hypothetical protein
VKRHDKRVLAPLWPQHMDSLVFVFLKKNF